jgi:hypothetical protein
MEIQPYVSISRVTQETISLLPFYVNLPELFIKNADAILQILRTIKEKNFIIGIFYPLGEQISLHLRRCSPFAVFIYSFMGHFLASATTRAGRWVSTRE